jgi:hypothetical protein
MCAGNSPTGRDKENGGEMHHHRAEKGARGVRPLVGQKSRAERYGNKQQCDQRGAGGADEDEEVVPALQFH